MLLRLLRTHLRPYRRMLWWILVVQIVQVTASLMLPSLNRDIIDKGVATGDTDYIWRHGGLMLVMSIISLVFTIIAVMYGSKVANLVSRDLRAALFHKVTDFSQREINSLGASSLITRVTNDVSQVQLLVQMTTTSMLAAPITAIGGVVMAMREDVGLTVVLAVAIPLLLVSVGLMIARMMPAFRTVQERVDALTKVLREQITGIRVVRAFVREGHERHRFESENAGLTRAALTGGRIFGGTFPTALLIINLSSVAVVWLGADRIAEGSLQIGAMVAFLSYLIQILFAVMLASFIAAIAPRAIVSAERIGEVLDTEPSVATSPDAITEFTGPPSVELRGAGFRYPGAEHPVLSGIDLRCAAGTTTAIIGSTGSGKTTLLNLVARLVDATEGSVLVGGVDVRRLDTALLWQRIGLVPQKPYLFAGTVASNLRFGKPDATDDELWEALTVAQADDFVRAMPGGLDAPIAQGGSNVSGGQRQRLSIARALVRRPDVYLFDDSLSALDMATDARLRTALAPWTRDAVVLLVAQRVTSIRHADQILVLEDGEAVGLGTHDELVASCPTYSEIVNSQLTEAEARR